MPLLLILASSPSADAQAQHVAADLAALGFNVGSERSAKAARIERAQKVVLLWSRAARGTPALRAAAQRAKAKGKLVCVALDAAPPPLGAKAQKLPRQRAAWRRILRQTRSAITPAIKPAPQPLRPRRAKLTPRAAAAAPAASVAPPPRQTRKQPGLLTLFSSTTALALVLLAGVAEAYASDAAFAARVDAWIHSAKALVASLAN